MRTNGSDTFPGWRIEMLGTLRACRGEQIVTHFETRRAASLLAFLAYHPGRSHPREALMELLWPEEDPKATRPRFRQTLACLRRAIEPDDALPGGILVADRLEVRAAPGAMASDVAEYEQLLQRAAAADSPPQRAELLARAIGLYRGELLPGYFEEWIFPERERLDESYQRALGALAEALAESGRVSEALDYARRAVTVDPLREESQCRLMRLYGRAGRAPDALRQYREFQQLLKAELGLAPGWAVEKVLAEVRSEAPAEAPRVLAVPPRGVAPSEGAARPGPVPTVEPVGGAVPLQSPFYVTRPADEHFHAAIGRRDSIVLVKGPRQVGKTSLLARGLQAARSLGMRVVLTDCQNFTGEQLADTDTLFLAVAEVMAEELELDVLPEDVWNPQRGWNVNFERYLRREVLGKLDAPLVWALDEVDRLFGYPFASEVFGVFRSWHNARSLNPAAPWANLTLAIAYATEAHLFITDLNQSPFNVGTRLSLEDFTPEQVEDLNRRYGSPLRDAREAERFQELLGGHPYLVRHALNEMARGELPLERLDACADRDDSPFSDHLRRLLASLHHTPALADAVREVLEGRPCPTGESFYRLRSAGVLRGESAAEAQLRCGLYRRFLRLRLR